MIASYEQYEESDTGDDEKPIQDLCQHSALARGQGLPSSITSKASAASVAISSVSIRLR